MKIAIVDTYYPDAIKAMPIGNGSYQEELDKVLARQFGTADFYSREFRKLGFDAFDIIANHDDLQKLWAREIERFNRDHNDSRRLKIVALSQICDFKADVVFLQDLSLFSVPVLESIKRERLLVGQLSCPWPGDERVKQFSILYSSFPHYIPRIEKLGVKAVFMPLAFSESVLPTEEIEITCAEDTGRQYTMGRRCDYARTHDCIFVGGVGCPSHWSRGMETLEYIASAIPSFKWWGYGIDQLPANTDRRLWLRYQGPAWGRDMYDILLRSKILINRHGEVAEGYANNMRLFEATGCGALLLTEAAPNLSDYFAPNECVTYSSAQDAVMKIKYYMEHESERAAIAARGQRRTLRDHTYAQRVPKIAEVLMGALQTA